MNEELYMFIIAMGTISVIYIGIKILFGYVQNKYAEKKKKAHSTFYDDFVGGGYMDCPSCGREMRFEKKGLQVNLVTEGMVPVEDFYVIERTCNNPLCEWSKVDV